MVVYALWHGGHSYALGDLDHPPTPGTATTTSVEVFASLREAGYALNDRYHHGDWSRQRFNYADGTSHEVFTPTVDDSSEMLVWFSDPRESHDPYPDRRIYFGPRLGVRVEAC